MKRTAQARSGNRHTGIKAYRRMQSFSDTTRRENI
jgi:hypothetical protein